MSSLEDDRDRGGLARVAGYLLLLGITCGGFLLVRRFGLRLTAPAPALGGDPFAAGGSQVKVDVLMHVLLAMGVIISTARLLGALFAWVRQPPVIGEVIAGILLGPSLLGRVWPEATAFVLPPTVAPFLSVLSQVGVSL